MRKYVIALAAALLPTMGMFAQVNGAGNTDKWIKNVDASVTLGTTGVGVDVAGIVESTAQQVLSGLDIKVVL